MKVIRNIRSLNTKVYLDKFEKLHVEKSNSIVSKFHSQTHISNNVMETDSSSTSINDDSFNVNFSDSLYGFLNNSLPETIDITRLKQGTIAVMLNTFPQLESTLVALKPNVFFDNFLSGLYDSTLGEYGDLWRESYYIGAEALNENTSFIFLFKDILGNVHSTSKELTHGDISQGYSSVINCPLDDTTTSAKDGFTIGEDCLIYYKNTFYNKEYRVESTISPNNNAYSKSQLIVSNVEISGVDAIDFNELLHELNKKDYPS
jgi:hypothetical protein